MRGHHGDLGTGAPAGFTTSGRSHSTDAPGSATIPGSRSVMTHNLPGWGYYLCTVDAFLGRWQRLTGKLGDYGHINTPPVAADWFQK